MASSFASTAMIGALTVWCPDKLHLTSVNSICTLGLSVPVNGTLCLGVCYDVRSPVTEQIGGSHLAVSHLAGFQVALSGRLSPHASLS